jgi:protein-disulfide isomerase
VQTGKQMLITRGALTAFSIANDVAKYFAILPAMFGTLYASSSYSAGPLAAFNIMHLASPQSANTAVANTNAPTFSDVKKVASDDYVRGNKDAKVTLIEYSDLECPYCKTFHTAMTQVYAAYKDKVAFVFRHFPLSFHANAQKEAEAALCVGDLGGDEKYFAFVDKIFERTSSNGTGFALDALGALAKEVGVNQAKFQSCLDEGKMAARVTAEEDDGAAGGATGTPTTFVVDQNGKTLTAIPGAYTFDQVKSILDQAL